LLGQEQDHRLAQSNHVGRRHGAQDYHLKVFGFLRRLFSSKPEHDPLAGLEPGRVRLIVGLGNPGPEYQATRHNLGFRCVDELARRCHATWTDDTRRTQSFVALGEADDRTLLLAKPHTFMNRSGEAVRRLIEHTHTELPHVLIVYDDMDLPFGALRLRERGSPGTHNGMRSVAAALGSEDIPRLRIGISQAAPGAAIDHVLSGFAPEEEAQVQELVMRAADAAYAWATENAVVAMNRYNKI
jgi:PTH1 family peptidyl-tRNA hydrolase